MGPYLAKKGLFWDPYAQLIRQNSITSRTATKNKESVILGDRPSGKPLVRDRSAGKKLRTALANSDCSVRQPLRIFNWSELRLAHPSGNITSSCVDEFNERYRQENTASFFRPRLAAPRRHSHHRTHQKKLTLRHF